MTKKYNFFGQTQIKYLKKLLIYNEREQVVPKINVEGEL